MCHTVHYVLYFPPGNLPEQRLSFVLKFFCLLVSLILQQCPPCWRHAVKLCYIVQCCQRNLWSNILVFWKAAPPLSALAKNLLWSRSCEFQQWGYLTDSLCPRHVLPFKIHDNKLLNPYSACSFLILGLAGFARYTDRNLVVASERKKIKDKNW